MNKMKKILCAVDLGENTDEVCRQGANLARALNGEALLVHVAASLGAWRQRKGHFQAELGARGEILESGRSPLPGSFAEQFDGVPVAGVAVLGDPAETLVRLARERECGIIVMGRRRGGLSGRIHPSVSKQVSRLSGLPVMLVGPPPDPTESVSTAPMPRLTRG